MRLSLFLCLAILAASASHAQTGDLVIRQVGGRSIAARNFVSSDQYAVRAGGVIEIADYGYSVVIPEACVAVLGDSGGHVHGVGASLDRAGCGHEGSKSVMGLWPDFNAMDASHSLKDYLEFSDCADSNPVWGAGVWRGAIDGLKTAMCRRVEANGAIVVSLVASSGAAQAHDATKPDVFYKAYLYTSVAHEKADMTLFRAFVCSIDVLGEGSGSTLCGAHVS